jgi:hypothetical protein
LQGDAPWKDIFSTEKIDSFALIQKIIETLAQEELYETMKEFKIVTLLMALTKGRSFIGNIRKYLRKGCQSMPQFERVIKLINILLQQVPDAADGKT